MLTADQIHHYREKGYLLAGGIFRAEQLDCMEAEFDRIAEIRSSAASNVAAGWKGEWRENLPAMRLVHAHDLQTYSAVWSRVLLNDKFTKAMAKLIGPDVQLHHCKLFQKPPENGAAFPMHQDYPYFPHQHHSMMACTIHLSDASEQMGCMRVIPGSHKLGPLPVFRPPEGNDEMLYLNPAEYPIEKAVACPARRGEVLFFNYLTIHGSGVNVSDQVRKTVLVQVRDAADRPTEDMHRSHSQGLMLHGINPLECRAAAEGTLDDEETANADKVSRHVPSKV